MPPGLQTAYQQARHQVEIIEEKSKPTRWRAVNANNHLSVAFDGKGIVARSTKDDWHLMMELNKIGAPEKLQLVNKPNVTVKDNRLTYDRGNIKEWYINDPRGLEQGFTLDKPLSKERLVLQFALGGNVKPVLIDQGKALQLITPKGKKLRYEGLKAWDATGRDLKATMGLKGHSLQLKVAVADAAYPITIDPWLVEEVKLIASDAAAHDLFGFSVAVSGDTAVVGARDANNRDGSAYVFTDDGTNTWSQQAKLIASDPGSGFGNSVAISGDTAVVGVSHDDNEGIKAGSVYVFTRNSTGIWSQQAKLTDSNVAAENYFGDLSVAISDDTAMVGVQDKVTHSGSVYVFTRDGTGTWSQQPNLTASDGGAWDQFGRSLAISGDTAVAGAYWSGLSPGSAYVFTRNGAGIWSQQAKLTGSDVAARDHFGWSVAVSGDTTVVGSITSSSAYIFTRDGTGIWSQQAKLTTPTPEVTSYFGQSVTVSGNTVVVGALQGSELGHGFSMAYVFTRSGTTWSRQAKLAASDAAAWDEFGRSVAISGNTVVVGARNDNDGAAYVFDLSCDATYTLPNNQWRQISLPCDPGVNNKVGDVFGDDDLGTYVSEWILYRYDTALDNYVPLTITDTLSQGVGYWITQISGADKTLDMPAGSLPTPIDVPASATTCASAEGCFEIPLATQAAAAVQWNMIGYAFADIDSLKNARVLTGVVTAPNDCSDADGCTLNEAQASSIVHNELWTYNGSGGYTKITGGNLDPWAGYWSATMDSADGTTPKLLMPKP